MAGVKVKPAAAYVVAADPVVLVDPTTGAPYAAAGGSFTAAGTATAAAPSYSEGTSNPFSMDLSGALRVTGSFSASSVATATAAAPSYGEGTSQPFSQNLSGDLRTIAKQSGAWTVAATQSGTWNIGTVATITNPVAATQSGTWNLNNISGTISLPTGASTVASQGVPSAAPYAGTGDGTEISIGKGIYGLLATPATQLPKTPLLTSTDLSYVFNSSSASTTRSLVAAVASQTTRGYRLSVTAAAATTLNFTDGSGGTVLYTIEFPAAGAYVFDLDSRAYFTTSANTALHVISSAAVKTTVALFYLTSV
ncbi:MAG: hypothetical protein JSS57_21475 [Proteobacteria bacterium]|nr:hypothetical protein [Pseudomonadota bacterium]